MGQEANSPFWIRFNNANIRGSVKHSVLTSLNSVDPLSNWSCSATTSEQDPRSIVAYVTGVVSAVNKAAASSKKGMSADGFIVGVQFEIDGAKHIGSADYAKQVSIIIDHRVHLRLCQ